MINANTNSTMPFTPKLWPIAEANGYPIPEGDLPVFKTGRLQYTDAAGQRVKPMFSKGGKLSFFKRIVV